MQTGLDHEYELDQLAQRIRKLETKTRRATVGLVEDDDAIDGSCSKACADYFVDLVTIPGAKSLIIAKHAVVKSLWAIAFIIGFGLTLYYVYRNVETFIREPTATKVKLAIMNYENYSYPPMLLCPDTWLDVGKALKSGATIPALQYALGYMLNYYRRPPPYTISDYPQAKVDFEKWYESGNFSNLIHLFKEIALDSEDFIYKCPDCTKLSFTKVLMEEAVCYNIILAALPGSGTARSAVDLLEVKIPNRSGGLLPKKKYWKFFLAPDLTVGVPTVQHTQVYPGYSNMIKFTPVRLIILDKPGDHCMHIDDPSGRQYSRIECALNCPNRRSKCTNLGEFRQDSVPRSLKSMCHYYPRYYWSYLKSISLQTNLADAIPLPCFEKCPPPCIRWLYDTKVEAHEISRQIANETRITRFYFSNQAPLQHGFMSFEEINTFAFTTMLGNVGGDLALWLGISLISVIQIVVFLISWILARYWRKAKKWKMEHLSQDGLNHTNV